MRSSSYSLDPWSTDDFLMLGSYAVELFTVFRLQGGFAPEMFVDSFSCLTHVHAVSDG